MELIASLKEENDLIMKQIKDGKKFIEEEKKSLEEGQKSLEEGQKSLEEDKNSFEKEKKVLAKRMLEMNLSIKDIIKTTGLSKKEIEELKNS